MHFARYQASVETLRDKVVRLPVGLGGIRFKTFWVVIILSPEGEESMCPNLDTLK